MSLSLISSVIFDRKQNKFAIGSNNNLIYYLKDDLKYFKNTTQTIKHTKSKLTKNVILMGSKTWYSIPSNRRPLPNRINIIITRNEELLKTCPFPHYSIESLVKSYDSIFENNVYFVSLKDFENFYKIVKPNVFIIGGESIYNYFLDHEKLKPTHLYLTEINSKTEFKWSETTKPTSFMSVMTNKYKLISYSEKYTDDNTNNIYFRFLQYKLNDNLFNNETIYLDLLYDVLINGKFKADRTHINVLSKFGQTMDFDISTTVPLLTSKYVNYKTVIEELLWFLRGDTDNNILKKKGINIWNGNTSREFLDERGLTHYNEGICGPIYGFQWRFFGSSYCQMFSDTSNVDKNLIRGGVDQINWVINELKTNPNSRRLLVSAWNPVDLNKMCLPPCHFSFLFYVEDNKYLNCLVNMRSNDLFLGSPFNIFSYAVLTYIIAMKTNLIPNKLKFSICDAHIYTNHLEQVKKQLNNPLRPLPMLKLNESIKDKNFEDITIDDFELIGYFPNKFISGIMAI